MADTIRDLRAQMPEGMTVQHTIAGQYRVNFRGGTEASAYYADDPQDALDTARAMFNERKGILKKVIRPELTHDEAQGMLAMTAIGMAFVAGHMVLALMLRAGATKAEWEDASAATKKLMMLVDPEKYERLVKENQDETR